MAEVHIIMMSALPSADPTRQGKTDTMIVYSVDAGTPATIILPTEEATEEGVKRAIAAQHSQQVALQGKTFTL